MLPLTCYSEALQEEGFIPFNGGFASAAREAFSNFSALIFYRRHRGYRAGAGPAGEMTSSATRRWW
ncbi:hypothetical protein MJ575_23710 [Klebsiella pneumoniae]|nr:hypothetical protein MJ575_23710 [Klebsiella pneumoniae]